MSKLHSRSKGKIAELKIELAATQKGYIVSHPHVDCYYDLILDPGTKKSDIFRAQIKYCNRLHGNNLELRLDSRNGKRLHYSGSWIDVILVYVPKIDRILIYNQKHFHKKNRLTINLNNKNSKWYYERYLW